MQCLIFTTGGLLDKTVAPQNCLIFWSLWPQRWSHISLGLCRLWVQGLTCYQDHSWMDPHSPTVDWSQNCLRGNLKCLGDLHTNTHRHEWKHGCIHTHRYETGVDMNVLCCPLWVSYQDRGSLCWAWACSPYFLSGQEVMKSCPMTGCLYSSTSHKAF